MRIIKELTTAVDIRDPIAFYSDENNLLNILRHRFELKCYKGCFILKINRVLRESELEISQGGAPDHGTICVTMEVTAIEYGEREVITGCIVDNRDSTHMLTCHTEYASIMVRAENTASINKGQIIPISVIKCRYTIGSNQISVYAQLYVPARTFTVYPVKGPIDHSLLASIKADIAAMIAQRETVDKKVLTFMTQALSPYKNEQPLPVGAKLIDPMAYPQAKFIAPATAAMPKVYQWDNFDESNLTSDIMLSTGTSPTAGVLNTLTEVYHYYRVINEMAAIYNTPELVLAHENLWAVYGKNKR